MVRLGQGPSSHALRRHMARGVRIPRCTVSQCTRQASSSRPAALRCSLERVMSRGVIAIQGWSDATEAPGYSNQTSLAVVNNPADLQEPGVARTTRVHSERHPSFPRCRRRLFQLHRNRSQAAGGCCGGSTASSESGTRVKSSDGVVGLRDCESKACALQRRQHKCQQELPARAGSRCVSRVS